MADVFILDKNRPALRTIFSRHCDSNELLPYAETLKFATALRIYPVRLRQDLLSTLELKRIFFKAADRFMTDDHKVELNYLQFERLLKLISSHCFSGDLSAAQRLQLLLAHICTPCQMQYKVLLQSEQIQRGDSFDSSTVLRKNVSLAGLTPSHRKSLGKPSASVTRVLMKSGTLDSLATERLSKAQVLKQKVQQLYKVIAEKDGKRSRGQPLLTVKGRKVGLDSVSPRATDRHRIASVPESTRQLSDTLNHYLSFDRKPSEVSIKLISPLPTYDPISPHNPSLLSKIKRALANLESKTDLALRRTKIEGKRKRIMQNLEEVFENCYEKVFFMQRTKLKIGFLRWKLGISCN